MLKKNTNEKEKMHSDVNLRAQGLTQKKKKMNLNTTEVCTFYKLFISFLYFFFMISTLFLIQCLAQSPI